MIELNQEIENDTLELAIRNLDARSQYIIKARWLCSEPQTFEDLAEQFNVSPQRIAQIEKQALQNIKEKLTS